MKEEIKLVRCAPLKQLINREDNEVRLIGLKRAVVQDNGDIRFYLPTPMGMEWAVWCGKHWLLADMDQPKARPHETEEFRAWLRERIKKQGYSAMGLSQSLGYSAAWLANILLGRSRLKEKDIAKMAAELGVTEKTLRSKRGAVAPKSGKSLHK